MPKDESDPEDPMEMVGVVSPASAEEVEYVARCIIEEFAWFGFDRERILSLFRDPHYVGAHTITKQMGEPWVVSLVDTVAREWGAPS
jgi:hypothetical protein